MLLALILMAADIHVSAAASLTNALNAIAMNYRRDRIVLNFGASGILARQIEEEAPADLFISADEATMDALQRKHLIDAKSRVSFLSNALVIIGEGDLGKAQRIAIGDPATVPAGRYAREYLMMMGLWGRLQPKLIPVENVRAVLASVESGNVDAGFVYRTDAMISKRVRIAREIKGLSISYPAAITAHAEARAGAQRFLAYLRSRQAAAVFRRNGFIVK
jgi:molybdate transport system substrate-binding protein